MWERCAYLLVAINQGGPELDSALQALGESESTEASILAELLIERLENVSELAIGALSAEAERHPQRWLGPLRAAVASGPPARASVAGELLERIGEPADIRLLNTKTRRSRLQSADRSPGRRLARRLAARAWIEDQGRLVVHVGERIIEGTTVRRKALALLAFLLTRPEFSATRDQVIDALWPDGDPSDAHNSLHQTLYFVRRIFEPDFNEETSPGYVTFASDVVWLDTELISSRSAHCRRILATLRRRWASETVDELAAEYRGRFCLEFAYEEWAASYRDFLHASYLEAVEREIRLRSARGEVPGALRLAQAALEADPDADEVELSVLRLYRTAGAHAAAAEQYAHYARAMKDLGESPPPLNEI
jgi:DNA-binding SARP family transcriptional activator